MAYQQMVRVITRNWKWDGPADGLLAAVLGVTDAGLVFGFLEAHLDRPAVAVALDDLGGGRGEVGGDQRELVAGGFGGVLDEDHAHRGVRAEWLPQAVDHGERQRLGLPVATDGLLDPA